MPEIECAAQWQIIVIIMDVVAITAFICAVYVTWRQRRFMEQQAEWAADGGWICTTEGKPCKEDADAFGLVILAYYSRDWGGTWFVMLWPWDRVRRSIERQDGGAERRFWRRTGFELPPH
jgi:hypothetical protein